MWVNHETKATSWTAPVEPEYDAWELVVAQVADVKRCVDRTLLLAYKDLFLVSGDRNAELYTGSAAMHSAQLDLLLVRLFSTLLANARACISLSFTDKRIHCNTLLFTEKCVQCIDGCIRALL